MTLTASLNACLSEIVVNGRRQDCPLQIDDYGSDNVHAALKVFDPVMLLNDELGNEKDNHRPNCNVVSGFEAEIKNACKYGCCKNRFHNNDNGTQPYDESRSNLRQLTDKTCCGMIPLGAQNSEKRTPHPKVSGIFVPIVRRDPSMAGVRRIQYRFAGNNPARLFRVLSPRCQWVSKALLQWFFNRLKRGLEMTALLSISDINTEINHEPRMLDIRLAEALGFSRPRQIRDLIKRHESALKSLGELFCRTVRQNAKGRPSGEYWLTKKQALYLCTKSETPNATEVTIQMVEVFDQVMTGQTVLVKEHRRKLPEKKQGPRTPSEFIQTLDEQVTALKRTLWEEMEARAVPVDLPDPYDFASHVPTEDLLLTAQGHLEQALKGNAKARWHTEVAAGCIHGMLNSLLETGLGTIHRKLVTQQAAIAKLERKAS